MLLRLVEFCRARGHDADAICRSVGLSPSSLADPDARVPYETAARLGERALAITRDENLGLHLAQDVRDTRNFDAGVLLMMASATVRVALHRMVHHQRYWGDGTRATLRRVNDGIAVRYLLPGAVGAYARHSDECAMAELALGVRFLSNQALAPRVVRFRHAPPKAIGEHRALFDCPIEFDADHTEIEFSDAVLDTTMQHANDAFFAIFEQQVERALARLPPRSSIAEGVRCASGAALGGGVCTRSGTARGLGVSTRTMQRRLRAEGPSFGDLIDALRHEMALVYVDQLVPAPQIASLLGYADATAFYHAFNRWTGSSPMRRSAGVPED